LQREWSKGYAAGRLRPSAWQQLPADAIGLVAQLCLWLPHDERLNWLLAELQNAREGLFVPAADTMKRFDEMFGQKPSWYHEMHEHRRILLVAKAYAEMLKYEPAAIASDTLYFAQGIPLHDGEQWDVAPLTILPLPLGAAPMLQTIGLVVAIDKRNNTPGAKREGPGSPPPEKQPATSAKWALEWKQIIVSFAAGMVLAMLISQQVRQYQRRRQRKIMQEAFRGAEGTRTKAVS